ncbi:MAG TPA: metallophosphoesterase, partial [Candidatus Dormibacteraeota bacterium]|nr:metallophosphoesterase [Candidatus Dormibacteraeota bacterium]
DVPLLYVPGNHDPSLVPLDLSWLPQPWEAPVQGPEGCENIDARLVDVRGLRIAGLGGSLRYKQGANQYSQGEMGRRALRLEVRILLKRMRAGRRLDVLVTHAPPYGVAEASDEAHVGFVAFQRLIRRFHPVLAVHGHIHPFGRVLPEVMVGSTRVVNVVPSRMIEI